MHRMSLTKESIVTVIARGLAGEDWPESAMFKVEYRTRTTMSDWNELSVRYFDSKEALDRWVTDFVAWAAEEGNDFEYHLYEWERGPKYITTVMFP